MKKLLFIASAFAAALLSLASCEREMEMPEESSGVFRTFTCTFAQPKYLLKPAVRPVGRPATKF